MSTPRDVRLIRVPSLRAAHRAIAMVGCHHRPAEAGECVVLVPSRAAAEALARTLERSWLDGWRPSHESCADVAVELSAVPPASVPSPCLQTRQEWYEAMRIATSSDRSLLSAVEREVLLGAEARGTVIDGTPPPFHLGPGLIAQMLEFYDALRRNLKTVDDFERLLTQSLEPSADLDRGAARMLQQTRFLAQSFRRFEHRSQRLDEHGLRSLLATASGPVGCRRLVVTLLDQAADPDGLWPSDFDLMTRLPGLTRIDVVATEGQLATGFHERLHDRLPGLVECRPDLGADESPVLVVPDSQSASLFFASRDREDELADTLRRLLPAADADTPAAVHDDRRHGARLGLVYRRPLPYLYVARQMLESAGVRYAVVDSLPLAAEPYVAAFDLVLSFVSSGRTRAATVAMLRSPHLRFEVDGREVSRHDVATLDAAWAALGFMGRREPLESVLRALPDECRPAAAAADAAAAELAALDGTAPPSVLIASVIAFLERHDRPAYETGPVAERTLRSRRALLDSLAALRDAESRFADDPVDVHALRATVRRWIEGQTFALPTGPGDLTLADTRAAPFGDVDEVHLLGLVEGEWPGSPERNIFFPASLLRELGWTGEKDRLASARAAFVDLLHLARRRTSVSTFSLEDDAIVRPAALLEDLAEVDLVHLPVAHHAGLPDAATSASPHAGPWVELRDSRPGRDDPRFHGFAGPRPNARYSVTALESYLACPFKYFASRVLGLDDESSGGESLTPVEHGRLVHEVLEDFFASSPPEEAGDDQATRLATLRRQFGAVVDAHVSHLPPGERQVERDRFLGTAATVGICDRVLEAEALLGGDVVERLVEYALRGEYPAGTGLEPDRRTVTGKADRVDLLAGGRLRIIDYKSGKAPKADRALQLPIYAACAERQLEGHRGTPWTTEAAAYVQLSESQVLVPVIAGPESRDTSIACAERVLTDTLEAIEAGRFPPQPSDLRLCASCAFASLCRKDYVDGERR